ncbi:MAG TPA: response regulator [Candidatus Acidoferrales bacterium]|nr:response regulator [Candidatus Acidoferrales bacterium]
MMPAYSGDVLFLPDSPKPFRAGGARDAGDSGLSGGPKKIKVMVVDDESTIADTLVEILAAEGFEAKAASTGHAAIELARDFEPDVVISDVVIPGMNGIEAGIKIRDILPECKVILFSGQAATVDLLKRAREEGQDFEILAKPIRPEVLISMIRRTGAAGSL